MRWCRLLLCVALLAGSTPILAQPKPSPDQFEPISEIPPEEQIPAIRLVAVAYGFVWILIFGYVWSVGRRLVQVEQDLGRLANKK
jgi:CcmD family protein